MEEKGSQSYFQGEADPGRFDVSKRTLRVDRFMTWFVFAGGLGVILAVFGIFLFILLEILPLFSGAEVKSLGEVGEPVEDVRLVGADEWSEYPFVLDGAGRFHFFALEEAQRNKIVDVELPAGAKLSSSNYAQDNQVVILGLSNGHYILSRVEYQADHREDGTRRIEGGVTFEDAQPLGDTRSPVVDLDFYAGDERQTVAGIVDNGGQPALMVRSFTRKRTLFGETKFVEDASGTFRGEMTGQPAQVLVGDGADALVIRDHHGVVHYYVLENGDWKQRQRFEPFKEDTLVSMNFIQGKMSLSLTSASGKHIIYSLYHSEEIGGRVFGKAKVFPPLEGQERVFSASLRNKAFLIGTGKYWSLRYGTTEKVRWEETRETAIEHAVISGKYDRIFGVDRAGALHAYALDDPHPEAGFRAFFGKIQYEGQGERKYIWQSTGGTDDFEPKLSLVPLIVGSLKGTFYAMIFALPIALLAAVYTSQFLKPEFRRYIKPGIEIMASLPSVVLGFIAALWLAPLIENRIPSVLLLIALFPVSAVLFGYLWNVLPLRYRRWIPDGLEFLVFIPLILGVSYVAWSLGPVLESLVFRVPDGSNGTVGDFRLWWESFSGNDFQQRNSLVVGFIMGFAVIPIIYTIAEDSMSSVPPSLVSGSLAMGASRWQTAARIVLPTASAGIFSAVMIGLGRAVGETMIVVMATGNTPIMDFDIFTGMRTLSANIAVELPEAPQGGTLYRTLFLGAFVLFVLTFMINTLAEVMRNRLREKYKVIS